MTSKRAKEVAEKARRAGLTARVLGRKIYGRGEKKGVAIRNRYGYVVTSRYEVANDWIRIGRNNG